MVVPGGSQRCIIWASGRGTASLRWYTRHTIIKQPQLEGVQGQLSLAIQIQVRRRDAVGGLLNDTALPWVWGS